MSSKYDIETLNDQIPLRADVPEKREKTAALRRVAYGLVLVFVLACVAAATLSSSAPTIADEVQFGHRDLSVKDVTSKVPSDGDTDLVYLDEESGSKRGLIINLGGTGTSRSPLTISIGKADRIMSDICDGWIGYEKYQAQGCGQVTCKSTTGQSVLAGCESEQREMLSWLGRPTCSGNKNRYINFFFQGSSGAMVEFTCDTTIIGNGQVGACSVGGFDCPASSGSGTRSANCRLPICGGGSYEWVCYTNQVCGCSPNVCLDETTPIACDSCYDMTNVTCSVERCNGSNNLSWQCSTGQQCGCVPNTCLTADQTAPNCGCYSG